MTRTEYIAKLTKYLRKLPQKDYEEALEYFMEYFEEAGPENEAQVIAELGTPKEAAHEVISRLLDDKLLSLKCFTSFNTVWSRSRSIDVWRSTLTAFDFI